MSNVCLIFSACRCDEGSTGSCSDIGQCSCFDNWAGPKCDQCEIGWDISTNCTQCKTGWTGDDCGQCDTDSGYMDTYPYCTSKIDFLFWLISKVDLRHSKPCFHYIQKNTPFLWFNFA